MQAQSYPSIKQSFGLLGFIILFTILISIGAMATSLVLSSRNPAAGTAFLTHSWTTLILYTLPFLLTLWWGMTHKKEKSLDTDTHSILFLRQWRG
ncbi:MAG: hypothetical protein U5R06_24355 [candidate division KSB1 bacterium]|nr:hypothetical protein [candidate division KSB1 bacterium]